MASQYRINAGARSGRAEGGMDDGVLYADMAVWRLRALTLVGGPVSLVVRPDDEGSISGGMSCSAWTAAVR